MKESYFRGDIVTATNPTATGCVQSGARPYLIISNNKCNQHSTIVTAIPFTTQKKTKLPTHHKIMMNNIPNLVLAEQITCLSKSNILNVVDVINDDDLAKIEECIMIQLGLKEIEK